MDKEEFIAITHFINPQLFWYHKVDGQNPDLLESKRIEDSVQLLYTAKQSAALRAHRPHVGEIVGIAFVSWNKFIRARVMHIVKYTKAPDEYIVWALDYGFPFQTKVSYIRQMPESHHKLNQHICIGGIADVIPAELDFDLVTTTSKIVAKPAWSQRCVEMLEKLLNDAASISFIESFQIDGHEKQHFGDMKVITHSGSTFFVSDYLVKLNHAVRHNEQFIEKLKTMTTNRIPCWETNSGDVKIIENKLNALNIEMGKFDLSGTISDTSCDLFAKQKVMDWCERNQNLNDKNEDTTDILYPKAALDATDIEFDDSVSVKNDVVQGVDDEETLMKSAGKLHENRRKKYEGKQLPPAPPLDNFAIMPEQPKPEKRTGRSAREKMLMELKKAHSKTVEAQKNEQLLLKQMENMTFNSNSETGTDEFLERCKMKNAMGLKKNQEPTDECQGNTNTSPKNSEQDSLASSTISRRKQKLMKIKETYCKQIEYINEHSDDRKANEEHSVGEKSDTKSQGSSYIENLMKKRNKLLQQRILAENSSLEPSTSASTQTPGKKFKKPTGYMMPQHSAKFSRLDFSKGFRQYATNAETMTPNETFDIPSTDDVEPPKPKEKLQSADEIRKLVNEDPFKNMTMVPGGFNVTKLVKRRDEANHWHTKKSTLNDNIHSNYDSFSANNSFTRRTEDIEEDFFRLTRSRKERKKHVESIVDEEDHSSSTPLTVVTKKSDNSSGNTHSSTLKASEGRTLLDSSLNDGSFQSSLKTSSKSKDSSEVVQKHLLDLSLNDSGCAPAITPEVVNNLLIFDDSPPKPDENKPLAKQDNSEEFKMISQLLDFDSTHDPTNPETLDRSVSSDSFLKEIYSVKDTSREKLIQTTTATTSEESFDCNLKKVQKLFALNKAKKKQAHEVVDGDSSSVSSSSFLKPEPQLENKKKEQPKNDRENFYEASESSVSSNSLPKIKNQTCLSNNLAFKADTMKKPSSIKSHEKDQSPSSSIMSLLPSPCSASPTPNCNKQSETSSSPGHTPKILTQKEYLQSLGSQFQPSPKHLHHLPEVSGEATLKTNFIQHLVLAHSKNNVKPIERMKNALFSAEIHQEMENMRLTKLYRIQSYAWSHLVRGNCFCVINTDRTGKTWCYLPPVCSMLSFKLESKGIPQTYGPAVIIIAPSSVQVESIGRHCRRILASTIPKISIVPAYGFRNFEEVKIELHNGCGVLVITPPCLQRLLVANEKENLLNVHRIQTLVIDGLDSVMKDHPEFDETLYKMVSPVLENDKIPFQLVVTSRTWTRRFINFLRIGNQPLLCIADYLEAAVYAKAKVSIKLQGSSEKMSAVMKCLDKSSYELERCVVICNSTDEVYEVERCLREAGYMCMVYTEQMPPESADMINEWKEKTVCHQILITNDSVLPELMIQNVWTLVHYSLPTSWTKFNFRFSLFLDNFENLLISNFEKPSKVPKALILLDEHNNLQLPRLIEFMKSHNQLKHIHPDILNVAARVTAEREEQRVLQNVAMCPKILEFGSCDEGNRCPYRHQLTKFDGPVSGLPTSGDIRLKILEVISPTHYIARILTHKQNGTWQVVRRSNEYATFSLKMSMHFINEDNRTIHWPLAANDLCMYKDGDTFHRCRLLEVPKILYESIVKMVNVKIKLIDSGKTIMCKSHDLIAIPEEFKDFPSQAVDIRLSGVVPFDNERAWDSKSIRSVRKWVVNDVANDDVLQANINFVLMDIVWVNNVVLMEQLPSINGFALKINVRRSLLGRGFALDDSKVHTMKQTAMENNLLEATLGVTTVPKPEEEENLLEFSTASSDDKNISNPVNLMSPVAPSKLDENKENINLSSKKTPKNIPVPVVVPKKIAREEWAAIELDDLCQVKIVELANPSMFFVRLLNKEDDVRELEDHLRSQEKLPLLDPHPMQHCLAQHKGHYYRAKIQRLLVDSEESCVKARVFFCDIGIFRNIALDKLRSSNKSIVEFMPFQAIGCKLTGINVECDGNDIQKCIQIEDSVHLAYAVKQLRYVPAEMVFGNRNYEIILYECFTDKKDIQINKMLVEHGLASYNEDTMHFLELETEVDFQNFEYEEGDSYDFQSFLDRIKQQMDEEDEEDLRNATNPMIKDDREEDQEPKIVEITEGTEDEPKIVEITEGTEDEPELEDVREEEQQPKIEEITEETEEDLNGPVEVEEVDSTNLPPLKALHKRPQTTWHETMCMIYLVIHAPDITDYHLEVHPQSLTFVADVNGETNVLILNLLGCVRPDMVTHEIRGLNVVVRLVKDLYMPWPRLLQDPTKFSWLKYNYNAMDMEDEMFGHLGAGTRLNKRRLSCSSDTSTSSRYSNPCETFTPIVNNDQVFDPMQDFD